MKNYKTLKAYELAVRVLLLFLFSYAAFSKAIVFPKFLVQLSESPLIPSYLVSFTAVFIIAIEFLLCVLLFTEKYARLGLLISYSLMLFFSLYILYILKLAPSIPCACGGILGDLDHEYHLAFNVIITLMILPTLLVRPDWKSGVTNKQIKTAI